ncbi:hypothetical protein VTN49DRAFT_1819 [Thermomyces lanuginosus]|uniref:uncharacterized protein n=1 Tax=Thermomyces lanuginosus TaxID=5541 RepID=UPI0037446B16
MFWPYISRSGALRFSWSILDLPEINSLRIVRDYYEERENTQNTFNILSTSLIKYTDTKKPQSLCFPFLFLASGQTEKRSSMSISRLPFSYVPLSP